MRLQSLTLPSTIPSTLEPIKLTVEDLPTMVSGVMGEDESTYLQATTQIRMLLSSENPPIQAVIDAGIVPRFVEFITYDQNPPLQFEASWALTNIASGTSHQTCVVVETDAIPIFVRLLTSPNDDVREQAVWALGNIAGDSALHRNQVLEAGAMQPLLQQVTEKKRLSMVRNATWTLSNLCRRKPQPDFDLLRPALPTLAQLIYSTDNEVLADSCWALSYLSDGSNDKIQAVIEAGVCRRLVELLSHESPAVQKPALRAVGNIVTGDDRQTQIIIDFSALPAIITLLDAPSDRLRKEAGWTLSNITAGNRDQIQAVIEAGGIPPLMNILKAAPFDVKKEAAWAIANCTSGGTPEQMKLLVDQGCLEPFHDLLSVGDPKIVNVALEGIENILKVGKQDARASGGFNQMAELIYDANGCGKIEQVARGGGFFNQAERIMETYFDASFLRDVELRGARLHLRRLKGMLRAYVVLRRMRLRAAEKVYAPGGVGFAKAAASFNALAAGLGCCES